jgi:hypothetical protein
MQCFTNERHEGEELMGIPPTSRRVTLTGFDLFRIPLFKARTSFLEPINHVGKGGPEVRSRLFFLLILVLLIRLSKAWLSNSSRGSRIISLPGTSTNKPVRHLVVWSQHFMKSLAFELPTARGTVLDLFTVSLARLEIIE